MIKDIIKAEIYLENIEEIGFLLSTHQEYILDDEVPWVHCRDIEDRTAAHLDCLLLGQNNAKEQLLLALESGSEDEFLGACYAIATLESGVDISHDVLVNVFSEADDELLPLLILALKYVKHEKLSDNLLSLLSHDNPAVRATNSEVLGYRGDADARRIWPLFHDEDEAIKVAALVAVMRLGYKDALPAMEQAVLENKKVFNEHCVFPLLMLGSKKALQFSRLACQSDSYIKPQYPIYIALAGNQEDIRYIVKALEFDDMSQSVLEALGIFGSLAGVNTLMKYLQEGNDEDKLVAAKSLNQISGAQLFETVEVTEKEPGDVGVEDVTGTPAASSPDDDVVDENVIEIKQDCTDLLRWQNWWKENSSRFSPSTRYRKGKPYTFFLCLEEIAHPETNHEDRQRAYNELVIRSGNHIAFEPDWFVAKQIEALKEWQSWWNQNKGNLNNPWMFDGANVNA